MIFAGIERLHRRRSLVVGLLLNEQFYFIWIIFDLYIEPLFSLIVIGSNILVSIFVVQLYDAVYVAFANALILTSFGVLGRSCEAAHAWDSLDWCSQHASSSFFGNFSIYVFLEVGRIRLLPRSSQLLWFSAENRWILLSPSIRLRRQPHHILSQLSLLLICVVVIWVYSFLYFC